VAGQTTSRFPAFDVLLDFYCCSLVHAFADVTQRQISATAWAA
jgi:hypothetical protein